METLSQYLSALADELEVIRQNEKASRGMLDACIMHLTDKQGEKPCATTKKSH